MKEEEKLLGMNSGLVECISWEQSIRNSHRDIHNTCQGKDKNRVEKSEKVSLGGEGAEGEADEGNAAQVGGGQGEQAKKQLHCSHLLWSNLCFQPMN